MIRRISVSVSEYVCTDRDRHQTQTGGGSLTQAQWGDNSLVTGNPSEGRDGDRSIGGGESLTQAQWRRITGDWNPSEGRSWRQAYRRLAPLETGPIGGSITGDRDSSEVSG